RTSRARALAIRPSSAWSSRSRATSRSRSPIPRGPWRGSSAPEAARRRGQQGRREHEERRQALRRRSGTRNPGTLAWNGARPLSEAVPATLDHLLWAAPDLNDAVEQLFERSGVRAIPGGQHPDLGTHNALARL